MHPLFCRNAFRTGFCTGLILFAIVLRLAAAPGFAASCGEAIVRGMGRPEVLKAILFLETGTRLRGDGGRGTGEAGRFSASPSISAPTGDEGPGTGDEGRGTGDVGPGTGNVGPGTGDTSFVTLRVPPSPQGEGFTGDEGRETGETGRFSASPSISAPTGDGGRGTGDEGPETGDVGPEMGDVGPGTGDTSFVTLRVPPSPRGEGFTGDEGRETGDVGPGTGDGRVGTRPYGVEFSEADAKGIALRGNCDYTADISELLLREIGWVKAEGAQVLIVHTHSCEAYTPSEGWEYESQGNFRTLDRDRSVVAVGDALAQELEKRGVEVIHDRAYNDYPSYNRSYATAREHILQDLEAHPSIRLVIDLHRDAMAKPVREITELDGKPVAKLMLVVGTDEGGLRHPHWPENLSVALKLQALGNRSAPGLFKDISFRRERFNGDLLPGEMIVEVGSTGNSLPEALAAAPYLAGCIAELLEAE